MNRNELKEIGKRISKERSNKGMTQSGLGVACNLNLKTISSIENGQREMKVDTLLRICDCLQVSSDYILYGTAPDSDAIYYKKILSKLDPKITRSIKELLESISERS